MTDIRTAPSRPTLASMPLEYQTPAGGGSGRRSPDAPRRPGPSPGTVGAGSHRCRDRGLAGLTVLQGNAGSAVENNIEGRVDRWREDLLGEDERLQRQQRDDNEPRRTTYPHRPPKPCAPPPKRTPEE
jgi:hypothetical protein